MGLLAEQINLFSSPPANDGPKTLRPYQEKAVEATFEALSQAKNPVVACATGGGKSLIIAALCQALPGRILVSTHRKELLLQNSDELAGFAGEDAGVYSAGLSRREAGARIVFGGIQSIYSRMSDLQAAGAFDTVIIDEAHRVPPPSKDSMYRQVFSAVNGASRIGLSATPYRLDDGPIWGDDAWFDTLACEINIRSLTPKYLAPLRGILTAHDIDLTGVRKQSGEYVLSDMSQVACEDSVVDGALDELCSLAHNRRHWLVFCIDVAHTELVTQKLRSRGIDTGMIVGRTGNDERSDTLERFKAGKLRALTGCMVFTEGFNIPSIDVVAMLRPSLSKALVVQMIGRGSRQAPLKSDCVIIDFAGNIERHHPLDEALYDCQKSPAREAKDKAEAKKKEALRKAREAKHGTRASTADPFGDSPQGEGRGQRVLGIYYELASSSKYAGKQNLKVAYRLEGSPKWAYSWICPEYQGGARWHADQWFRRRGLHCPSTAEEAIEIAKTARRPEAIVTRQEGKYVQIVLEQFAEAERDDPWE